jgi:hypothetical protein
MPGLASVDGLSVPIAMLAPLALSTALAFGLTAGDELMETVSSRPMHVLDTSLALGIVAIALAIGTVLDLAGASHLGAAAGRNGCGYVGLMLLGRRVVGGHAASLVPAAFALGAATFGGDALGQPQWWAWLLADSNQPGSWLLATALIVAGVGLSLIRQGPPAITR